MVVVPASAVTHGESGLSILEAVHQHQFERYNDHYHLFILIIQDN